MPAPVHRIARADDAAPWVLHVGTLGLHDPYEPPKRFLELDDPDAIELPSSFCDPMADEPVLYRLTRERFDQLTEPEHREALGHYLAFCSYEDELFGQVYDAVIAAGQVDDTIFIYLSDRRDYGGDHGLWCKGLPAFDTAPHIPTVIGGPGLADVQRGRLVATPISIVDIGPTLLDLCGVTAAAPMSGRSPVGALRGDDAPVHDEFVFQSNGNEPYGIQRVVGTDRWKLVVNYFDEDELYDLWRDPDEMINLLHRDSGLKRVGVTPVDAIPDRLRPVVKDLYQRLWRFALAHNDDLTNDYTMTAFASYGPGATLRDSAAGLPNITAGQP